MEFYTVHLTYDEFIEFVRDSSFEYAAEAATVMVYRNKDILFFLTENLNFVLIWYCEKEKNAALYLRFAPNGSTALVDKREFPDITKPQTDFFPTFARIYEPTGSFIDEIIHAIQRPNEDSSSSRV